MRSHDTADDPSLASPITAHMRRALMSHGDQWTNWLQIVRETVHLVDEGEYRAHPDAIVAEIQGFFKRGEVERRESEDGMLVRIVVPSDPISPRDIEDIGLTPGGAAERLAKVTTPAERRAFWRHVSESMGSGRGSLDDLEAYLQLMEASVGRPLPRVHPGLLAREVIRRERERSATEKGSGS